METLFVRRLDTGHWPQRSHPKTVATFITELIRYVEGDPTPAGLAYARVGPSS